MINKSNIFDHHSEWKKIGEKVGGANKASGLGGIYRHSENNISVLVKKEPKVEINISEYMGGMLMKAISPQQAPNIDFVVFNPRLKLPNNGQDIYIKSQLFDSYTDLFKDMDNNMAKADKPSNILRKNGRPLMMGTREKFSKIYTKAFTQLKYKNFPKATAPSLLMGDMDIHSGNYGVLRKEGKKPKLVRIDFGWAFNKLTDQIHPHSFSRHLPFMGPTNHFREFPDSLKLNHKFADELFRTSNVPLQDAINKTFNELQKYYDGTAIRKWSKHSMPQYHSKNISIEEIKSNFSNLMQKRQESLKEYAIEIKLGLLVEKKQNQYHIKDPLAFKTLIEQNEKYFKEIYYGNKSIRLRDKNLTKGAKQAINNSLTHLMNNRKEQEVFLPLKNAPDIHANNKPIVKTPSSVQNLSPQNRKYLEAIKIALAEFHRKKLTVKGDIPLNTTARNRNSFSR